MPDTPDGVALRAATCIGVQDGIDCRPPTRVHPGCPIHGISPDTDPAIAEIIRRNREATCVTCNGRGHNLVVATQVVAQALWCEDCRGSGWEGGACPPDLLARYAAAGIRVRTARW